MGDVLAMPTRPGGASAALAADPDRSYLATIDPREGSVRVECPRSSAPDRGPYRFELSERSPEALGWSAHHGVEGAPRAVTFAYVIDYCLREPSAVEAVMSMTCGAAERAKRREPQELGPWRRAANALGHEVDKGLRPGRVSIVPLRELYIEAEARGAIRVGEMAERMGWTRSGVNPSPDTSRLERRLGLRPGVNGRKGRRRHAWTTSLADSTYGLMCRGLEVDPVEVDRAFSCSVLIVGREPDPPRPRNRSLKRGSRSRLLARYADRGGREHEVRLAGPLVVDEDSLGGRLLLAVLEPDEGKAQADALLAEYLPAAREAERPLCRALTEEEERSLALTTGELEGMVA